MKRIVFLTIGVFVFLFLPFSYAQHKENDQIYLYSYFKGNGEDGLHLAYSTDGYQWKALNNDLPFLTPEAGEDHLMRDPCIIRGGDGRFHMVWTVSWNEKGIGYASSKDLVHWSDQQFIPVMEHEKEARNCWAPEIFYNDKRKEYMIVWSTTITGLFPETQSQEESGYNHRLYYTTTKDFKSFSKPRLLCEPGFNVIDGTLLKDDGEYVLFVKDETREPPKKNLRIVRSKYMTKGFAKAGKAITGNYWAEGPTVAKVGDLWIAYFDKYREKQMGAVASPDLIHWTDISDKVIFPKGTRHGTVFTITRKEFEGLKEKI